MASNFNSWKVYERHKKKKLCDKLVSNSCYKDVIVLYILIINLLNGDDLPSI